MSSASSELNPTHFRNTILRAGAGAGKTTTLTETFLNFARDFKKSEGAYPRIVVTTFTRKATQELKERLLNKALKDHELDLFHYVSSRSQVQISTIHGVLSVFLSRYGSSIGLTPDYKILTDGEIRKNARQIIRKFILENTELQELLEEYDFQVLENILLQYFNQKIIFPDLNFITDTELEQLSKQEFEKLASDIKRVAFEIESETENDKWKEYAYSFRTFNWALLTESFSEFYSQFYTFWEASSKPQYRKANPPFTESLNGQWVDLGKKVDSFFKKDTHHPQYWQKHQKNCSLFQTLAVSFFDEFLKSKIDNGLLSMADLETLTYKIILDSPESAQKFSLEWDFWMVDEYQDTSPIQVSILKSLIGYKPAFVVGDPQQSIYLFRGARSKVFHEKMKEVEEQGGDVQLKLVNYRSNPEVLDFFNHYFTKLSSQFAAMTPAPNRERSSSQDPVVQVLVSEINEDKKISNESLAVVARIQELLSAGVQPEQICVLSRTHNTLEEIAKYGQVFGVPLQLHSGTGFYERREVLDALAILKCLVNPHDNANFVALFRTPWLNIDDSELAKYCHNEKHSYWSEASQHTLPENHPFNIMIKLREMAETLGLSWTLKKALIDLGVFDYSIKIDSTGRREANLWKIISLLNSEERRPGFNFLDFLDSGLETLSTDEGGEDADATPVIEPKRVNFMTVHASKGLQFDHVILPGMGKATRSSTAPMIAFDENNGQWTLKVRNQETQSFDESALAKLITDELKKREAEEFNRVLYVALTRAKCGVTLLWSQDPSKGSWAAGCPLNLEEGVHEEDGFTYLVRRDNPQPTIMAEAMIVEKQVRSLWHSESSHVGRIQLAVTELMNESANFGQQQALKSKQQTAGNPQAIVEKVSEARQGTDAHKLFEALKFSEYQIVWALAEDEQKSALEFLKDTKDLPLMDIIEKGFVEWGFSLTHDKKIIQGQIDLWGFVQGTAWIVDYKTGSQRYLEKAFSQLDVYAWALHKMKYLSNVTSVKLAVIYPIDQVVKIKEFNSDSIQRIEEKIQADQ